MEKILAKKVANGYMIKKSRILILEGELKKAKQEIEELKAKHLLSLATAYDEGFKFANDNSSSNLSNGYTRCGALDKESFLNRPQ